MHDIKLLVVLEGVIECIHLVVEPWPSIEVAVREEALAHLAMPLVPAELADVLVLLLDQPANAMLNVLRTFLGSEAHDVTGLLYLSIVKVAILAANSPEEGASVIII